jgi:hypothetical protein
VNLVAAETYFDVLDELERGGVRYVVMGGVAVVLHGHKRAVVDLDIVIDPAPEETNRVLHTLSRVGFMPSIPVPLSMLSVLRTFDHSGREVDVFVRNHIPFDELWNDSHRVRFGDGNSLARVASLEHLLRIKRTTGRPHDLLDIEGLLALEGGGRDSSIDEPLDCTERKEPA